MLEWWFEFYLTCYRYVLACQTFFNLKVPMVGFDMISDVNLNLSNDTNQVLHLVHGLFFIFLISFLSD
jgi:hypothetical protein